MKIISVFYDIYHLLLSAFFLSPKYDSRVVLYSDSMANEYFDEQRLSVFFWFGWQCFIECTH